MLIYMRAYGGVRKHSPIGLMPYNNMVGSGFFGDVGRFFTRVAKPSQILRGISTVGGLIPGVGQFTAPLGIAGNVAEKVGLGRRKRRAPAKKKKGAGRKKRAAKRK